MPICEKCKQEKPESEFIEIKLSIGTEYMNSDCRTCRNIRKKHSIFLRRYGLDEHQVKLLFEKHNHKCCICGKNNCVLNIDHSHRTNRVRGILCNTCNTTLGLFHDDVDLFKKIIEYLSVDKEYPTDIFAELHATVTNGGSNFNKR